MTSAWSSAMSSRAGAASLRASIPTEVRASAPKPGSRWIDPPSMSPFLVWRGRSRTLPKLRDDTSISQMQPWRITQIAYFSMLSCRPWGVGNREIGSRARQYSRLPISQLPAHVAKLRPGLNATTHAVFGVAALAGASLVAGTEPPFYAYPVAVAAAWLPDVDNPRSTLGNGLSRSKNPVLTLVSRPLSWVLRTASFVLVRTVGHRTLTHSLVGVVIFALPVWLLFGSFPNLTLAL